MQLTPSDAQMYWLASRIPNDQFLLYCFDGVAEPAAVRESLLHRARGVAELRLRVREIVRHLDYPYWVGCDVADSQVVVGRADLSWPELTDAVGALLTEQLDAAQRAWRIHLFPAVQDAPACAGSATIAVLQISHALGDGKRASALARTLFAAVEPEPDSTARPQPVPQPIAVARGLARFPWRVAGTLVRGRRADLARGKLAELSERGEIPPEVPGRPLISVNSRPGPPRVRMIVRPIDGLRAPDVTVTVAVLAAVAAALARYESAVGVRPARLGAEVTVANDRPAQSRNNFGNVGVELFPAEPDPKRRALQIAAALADRRLRAAHPLWQAQRAVTQGLPAPALRQEIVGFPLDLVPPVLTGNTVVSSVFRGRADLRLAGAPVRFTAGFPALSPLMGLTHGVHGIGDTVTISIVAGSDAVRDLNGYKSLLESALDDITAALRSTAG